MTGRTVEGELAHLQRAYRHAVERKRTPRHVVDETGHCAACDALLESKRPRQAEDTGRAETEGSEGWGESSPKR